MTMLEASVLGVSVWGPGLEGWAASRPILAGAAPYEPLPSPAPPPLMLAPTERRRAGPVVRLALTVATEAAAASGLPPASLRGVFASSNGDGPVVGAILDALAHAAPGERVVSPTQFHNSVHNAPAGYWSIANGSRQPATCLGAHDWTWAAALLKAMADVATGRQAVLLCCYDHPLPPPLHQLRPTGAAFGAGLVLGPVQAGLPRLRVAYGAAAPDAPVSAGAFQALMLSSPAARALPLLLLLARSEAGGHQLPYLDGRLTVDVAP
jgi:hypothetical protein